MSLITLVLATASMTNADVTVPPMVPFTVGQVAKSSFKITVQQPGSDKPTVLPGKLERKDSRTEDKGVRVYTISLDAIDGNDGKSNFELKLDAAGIPISCQELGEKAQQDQMNSLIFMLQQPLWPKSTTASSWKASLPNQSDKTMPISIDCSAVMDKDGKTILVTQKIKPTKEIEAAGLSVQSIVKVDAKTGKVLSVHEVLEVKMEKSDNLKVQFDIDN
ncbi:MAG: hypothetical protein WCG75_11460 [Armatimonadota bacterium]